MQTGDLVGVGLMVLLLQGCASTADPRAAQPMTGFRELEQDGRINIEAAQPAQDAEAYGQNIAAILDEAIRQVETAHGLRFAFTPDIYVCASESCFKHYVYTAGLSAAVIPNNRLVLSPNLYKAEQARLKSILIHELAHLHLGQRAGHYHHNIPIWFHEGWACLTAEGGGAEYATDAQAHEAARQGRLVNLKVRDTPDHRHKASAFSLNIHVFYRQSMLLVKTLRERDSEKFARLILALQQGSDFDIAFGDVYGAAPAFLLAGVLGGQSGDGDNGAAAPSAP